MTSHSEMLKEAILVLQDRRAQELKLLKRQFSHTYDSLRPINIIKSTIDDVVDSSHIKGSLISGAMGLTSGFLSRKILVGGSHGLVRNIFGSLLQFAVTGIVTKYSSQIKVAADNLISRFSKLR